MMPNFCSLPAASVTPSRRTPQHVGDQLLGHGQAVAGQPVEGKQQPATQLLIDGMVPVADRGLTHLGDQGLGVSQHEGPHRAMPVEFILELLAGKAVRRSRALHYGTARRALAAHEECHPDHAFVADHGDLGGSAVLHDVEERDNGVGREVDVPHGVARLIQDLPELQGHQLQVREHALCGLARQCGKDVILFRGGNLRHARPGWRIRQRPRRLCAVSNIWTSRDLQPPKGQFPPAKALPDPRARTTAH